MIDNMKTLTPLILILFTLPSFASELPPCPKDTYHNCFGTYTSSGKKYVGEFKNDTYHGKGTYTWADDEYIGAWGTELPDENKKKTPSKKKRHISKSKIVNLDGSKYIGIKKSTKK